MLAFLLGGCDLFLFFAPLATAVLRNKCQPLGTISFTLLQSDVENPSVGTGGVVVVDVDVAVVVDVVD